MLRIRISGILSFYLNKPFIMIKTLKLEFAFNKEKSYLIIIFLALLQFGNFLISTPSFKDQEIVRNQKFF